MAEPARVNPPHEITAAEAAEILGVTSQTVGRYLRIGKLTGRKVAEGLRMPWLVDKASVDALLESYS